MNHDVLILIFVLVTIPPILVLMWWIDSKPRLSVDEIVELKMKRVEFMMPQCVHLWQNLFTAIEERMPETDINKCAEDLADFIKLMVR